MKPPYIITSEILRLISEISQRIGEVNASFLTKQSPALRKTNRIRTIQASLAVEGNTLSVEQITALIDNRRVIGPIKDIKEVSNAIDVYDQIKNFNPGSTQSFLSVHKKLMQGLIKNPGQYRTTGVGILKGKQVAHLAPPAAMVPSLMKELFKYIKTSDDHILIKSCVFHYKMEFIHPFSDGNGRMGRFWQTLILIQQFPVFEFLPFETLIRKNQKKYYQALSSSDKQGNSTVFIAFMLNILNSALDGLLKERPGPISSSDRISIYISTGIKSFSRKDYMNFFKTISTATASRDLLLGVKENLIKKFGDKNTSYYKSK